MCESIWGIGGNSIFYFLEDRDAWTTKSWGPEKIVKESYPTLEPIAEKLVGQLHCILETFLDWYIWPMPNTIVSARNIW